jgi:succinate dehydrogenase / fumarate reductase flavoprotein subunit
MSSVPSTPASADARTTDVLVIGGGVAGMYAALKAHDAGARVLLISKGPLGRSGGTAFAGTLVSFLKPEWLGLPPSAAAGRIRHSDKYYGLMDEGHLHRASEWIPNDLLPELEEMGLYFRRQPDGRLLHNPVKPKHTWTPKMGMSGRAIGDILRRHVFDAGIPVIEEGMATSLLVSDGVCYGATFLNILTGEFFAVRAATTILCTGHANYLSKRSTGTREVCGDTLSLMYRAGAELFNLEMVDWHVTDMAWPRSWMRLHIYPNPMPASPETMRMVGPDGTMFFEQKLLPKVNKPYHVQHRLLWLYARQRGRQYADFKEGGYYADLRHIDPHVLHEYSYQTQFPEKIGVDPTRQLVETAPTYHYVNGGGWVDWITGESRNIRNLFAAGSSAGRDGQTDCMYDGLCSAQEAIGRIGQQPTAAADRVVNAAIDEERDRVLGFLGTVGRPNGVRPQAVKNQIRDVMWQKFDYEKTADKMRSGLDDLAEIRAVVAPAMALPSATHRFNYDWVDALDVWSMLDAAVLTIQASLLREESRGPFFRADFPEQDNERWLKYIIARREDGGIQFRYEAPVYEEAEPPTPSFYYGAESLLAGAAR